MGLEAEINKNSAKVSTDSYSMSIGELASMYKSEELDIHPEFQRFFRWTIEQKSKFIESLLLGIPIPPIFVSEKENSKWDVIDGLQRLSTIFELMGELRDENGRRKEKIILTRTKYLPNLDGMEWTSKNDLDASISDDEDERKVLPESAQIKIKRARLDINIVKNTSDDIAKYEIFQRLNTGGSIATDQEVRNCILIMNNRDFFHKLKALGDYPPFEDCLLLTERAKDEAFDLELVTRFIVFSTIGDIKDISRIDELGEFLTDELVIRATDDNFDFAKIERVFKEVFDYLSETLGENSFRKFNSQRQKYYGGTLVSLYEVIAVSLGHSFLNGLGLPKTDRFMKEHRLLADNVQLKTFTKSGVRSSTRIPKTIQFGRKLIAKCV